MLDLDEHALHLRRGSVIKLEIVVCKVTMQIKGQEAGKAREPPPEPEEDAAKGTSLVLNARCMVSDVVAHHAVVIRPQAPVPLLDQLRVREEE